jgi:hypothetical protein
MICEVTVFYVDFNSVRDTNVIRSVSMHQCFICYLGIWLIWYSIDGGTCRNAQSHSVVPSFFLNKDLPHHVSSTQTPVTRLTPHPSPYSLTMPRKPPFKIPFRHRTSRGSISSRSSHTSVTSRRSEVRAVSTASSAPSRRRRNDTRGQTEQVDPRVTSPSVREDDTITEHENNDDDTLSEVVMAIDMAPRGTVGCCYYVSREEKLYFMEDIQIGDVNIVDTREALVRTRSAELIRIQSKPLLILP